jgi:hypothetical protein
LSSLSIKNPTLKKKKKHKPSHSQQTKISIRKKPFFPLENAFAGQILFNQKLKPNHSTNLQTSFRNK